MNFLIRCLCNRFDAVLANNQTKLNIINEYYAKQLDAVVPSRTLPTLKAGWPSGLRRWF